MPEIATLQNTLVDKTCSKCKKIKEPHYFQMAQTMYKTCNSCRFTARQNSRGTTWTALTAAGYNPNYIAAAASSSSASSTTTADYFGPEPDPEPKP